MPAALLVDGVLPGGGLVVDHLGWLIGVAVLVCGLLVLRWRAVRRTLQTRGRIAVVPADSFDPSSQAVASFAAQLARTRRALLDWIDGPARAVRVLIDHDADAVMRYRLEAPERDLPIVRAALGAYTQLQLHDDELADDPAADSPSASRARPYVARAELVLARPASLALADVGLDPDPLQALAGVIADARGDLGDRITVALDLRPVAASDRRRLRGRLVRQTRSRMREQPSLAEVLRGPDATRRRPSREPVDLVTRRAEVKALAGKLGSPQPLLAMQLLLRCESRVKGRERAHLMALLSCFDALASENHLRVAGVRLAGLAFLGSDLPLVRRRFDRRMRSGLFAPARRRQVVTPAEIGGLLKPPSVHCDAPNVERSGGMIDPPPPGLPTFDHQLDLIPLGRVAGPTGERLVGVRVGETVFAYLAGRSRYGKTETGICQFVHLARSGHGGLFLDPHADALREIKSYLTDPSVAERVVEIDLSDLAGRHGQPAWNPFDVHGRPGWEAGERVEAVTDAFAAALGWDERNTRALNLTSQSAQALVELARVLPRELAPTLFQIPSLLSDEGWRATVLPHVSAGTRAFFTDRFPRLSAEAITPITNVIDRLRVAGPVAALFGSPVSTLDMRAAMDSGRVVLVCPGTGSTRDQLVAAILVYEVLHAIRGRAQQPADGGRRPFWLFLDELQTYDGPNLPVLLEQAAKFGGRAFMFNQNPERLTSSTLSAVTTNRSHLGTSAVNAKAAGLLSREWGGDPDPATIARLARYTYLAQVTLGHQTSRPFLVRGVPARELHADAHHPERVAQLDATIDRTTSRQPIDATLAALDGHDQRIAAHLRERGRPTAAEAAGGPQALPSLPALDQDGGR